MILKSTRSSLLINIIKRFRFLFRLRISFHTNNTLWYSINNAKKTVNEFQDFRLLICVNMYAFENVLIELIFI